MYVQVNYNLVFVNNVWICFLKYMKLMLTTLKQLQNLFAISIKCILMRCFLFNLKKLFVCLYNYIYRDHFRSLKQFKASIWINFYYLCGKNISEQFIIKSFIDLNL